MEFEGRVRGSLSSGSPSQSKVLHVEGVPIEGFCHRPFPDPRGESAAPTFRPSGGRPKLEPVQRSHKGGRGIDTLLRPLSPSEFSGITP